MLIEFGILFVGIVLGFFIRGYISIKKRNRNKESHRLNPFGMTDYEWAHFDDDWDED